MGGDSGGAAPALLCDWRSGPGLTWPCVAAVRGAALARRIPHPVAAATCSPGDPGRHRDSGMPGLRASPPGPVVAGLYTIIAHHMCSCSSDRRGLMVVGADSATRRCSRPASPGSGWRDCAPVPEGLQWAGPVALVTGACWPRRGSRLSSATSCHGGTHRISRICRDHRDDRAAADDARHLRHPRGSDLESLVRHRQSRRHRHGLVCCPSWRC